MFETAMRSMVFINIHNIHCISDLQCMIEHVKVELVGTILLLRFIIVDQYIRLVTRTSLPE